MTEHKDKEQITQLTEALKKSKEMIKKLSEEKEQLKVLVKGEDQYNQLITSANDKISSLSNSLEKEVLKSNKLEKENESLLKKFNTMKEDIESNIVTEEIKAATNYRKQRMSEVDQELTEYRKNKILEVEKEASDLMKKAIDNKNEAIDRTAKANKAFFETVTKLEEIYHNIKPILDIAKGVEVKTETKSENKVKEKPKLEKVNKVEDLDELLSDKKEDSLDSNRDYWGEMEKEESNTVNRNAKALREKLINK